MSESEQKIKHMYIEFKGEWCEIIDKKVLTEIGNS